LNIIVFVFKLALHSAPMSFNIDRNEEANLVPDDVRNEVETSLKLGRVLPIFHAYCARFFVDYDSHKEGGATEEDVHPEDQNSVSRKRKDGPTVLVLKSPRNKQKRGATASAGLATDDSSDASRNQAPHVGAEVIQKRNHAMSLRETTSASLPTVRRVPPASLKQAAPGAAIETTSAGPHATASPPDSDSSDAWHNKAGVEVFHNQETHAAAPLRRSSSSRKQASPGAQATLKKAPTSAVGAVEKQTNRANALLETVCITGATMSVDVATAGGICGSAAAGIPLNSSRKVEKQKNRAKALWETVCAVSKYAGESYGGDGLIPPICLTYGPRLFAECDNSPYVLSMARVTAGNYAQNLTVAVQQLANEYESAFLFKDNGKYCANEIVGDDGLGVFPHCWKFHSALTDAVCNLVNASSVMVGHDVEVTQVSSTLTKMSGLLPGGGGNQLDYS
jgi:hypothetical protein